MNAIGACENGHAEVKVEDGSLHLWFVGGGRDTNRAVPVSDGRVVLSVQVKPPRDLVLQAEPLSLLGESRQGCSHFVGRAPWLADLRAFRATATVTFRGRRQELVIEHPTGYDPDEETGEEHHPNGH